MTDPSDAAVPGAAMKLTNTNTGLSLSVQADQGGAFQFLQIPPGTYVLGASSTGFQTYRREGISVAAGSSVVVPVQLVVGDVSQTIEVQGGAPLLELDTSSVGTVMDQKRLQDLPLIARNALGLANLVPTVRGISDFGQQVTGTFFQLVNIGGAPALSNAYLMDGVPNDAIGDRGTPMTYLPIDATEEFKVLTSSFSAEYGRTAGGVVSIISKGGTNEFHGNLFEFNRNTVTKANDFFANRAGVARPILNVNQYGGSVGGPIIKDKLFFFANYEAYTERRTFNRVVTSPTDLQRSGDFSQTRAANGSVITIFDPLTSTPNPSGTGFIRSPFPNNAIPPGRLSVLARNMLALYPKGNTAGAAVTGINNLVQTGSQPTDRYNVGGRLDYYLSAQRRFAARYHWDRVTWIYPNYWKNTVLETDGRLLTVGRPSASFQYTDTLSATTLLEVKLGYNREYEVGLGTTLQDYGKGFDPVALGYPANLIAQLQPGRGAPKGSFPQLIIADLPGVPAGLGRSTSIYRGSSALASSLALTKVMGSHNLRMGYQYTKYEINVGNLGVPVFNFDRGFTQGPNATQASATGGFGVASFLLGYAANGNYPYNPENAQKVNWHGLFVQDDWKVSRKLTLNLGLRWEYEQPLTDRFNIFTNIDLNAPSPLNVPGLNLRGGASYPAFNGGARTFWDPSYRHFAPRPGFAYQVRRNLVVRGAYGIGWIPTKGYPFTQASGFTYTNNMIASINGGVTPYNTMADPFPNGIQKPVASSLGLRTDVGSTLLGLTRSISPGYTQQWNLSMQYQPASNWVVEAAYIGDRGVHLMANQPVNYNQLNPQHLALGSQLQAQVANPFYNVITVGPLSTPTIARGQLLRPYPQFTDVLGSFAFIGDSIYHALTLKVDKRFSQGFSLLLAYTNSKLIDSSAGSGGSLRGATGTSSASAPSSPIQNWYDRRRERSKSAEDVPQRLVLTGLWEVPFGKRMQGWQRRVFDGWQMSTIATLQSGFPIAPIAGNVTFTGTGAASLANRPNATGQNPAAVTESTLARWFNTAAYSVPAPFTYGNAGRTIPNMAGPGSQNVDFSIIKNIPINERITMQLRGEAYNLLNTARFDLPGRDATAQSFGLVQAVIVNSSREMQFSLKLTF